MRILPRRRRLLVSLLVYVRDEGKCCESFNYLSEASQLL